MSPGAAAAINATTPATCGVAMLVPLLVLYVPPGQVDCTKTPGATTSTDAPKLLNSASVSSHSVEKSSRMNLQPASRPRTVSKSVRADTLMTSGNAAGTKLPALTAELPDPATMMIPAALAAQTAA